MVGTFLLAGCGGAASGSVTSSGASVAASAATSSAPASSAASSGASSAPASAAASTAASGAPIKIGVLEPLTGGLSNNGKDNKDALNLFLSSVHNTIAGHKIDLIYADTQGAADVGLTKAKNLVESQKVSMLMGITSTPVSYAIAGYAKQAHVPLLISGNAGAQNLTTDPKYASKYLVRVTQNATGMIDPAADWAYKQGYRKAILITSDYGGGLETSDAFASTFIKRGGSIIQELHPAIDATDYGPYITEFSKQADLIAFFFPGIGSLRFVQAYANYAGAHKPQLLDMFGQASSGPNLQQEQDKALGIIGEYAYSTAAKNPQNAAFMKAWAAKYPGRYISDDAGMGYASGEVLKAAIESIKGKITTQSLLNALYATHLDTVKGPISLDKNHDVVQNIYFYKIVKQGSGVGQQLLHTYTGVSRAWDRSAKELTNLPFGQMKGKWVGMTKAKLDAIINK